MEEKISIIVPVYNAEKTLYKCVESLILQKYKNIEIILINDKSTDNSNKICEKLTNEYDFIKYIINEKNMGVSATRNIGLDNATGEYIVFVDSDDWVDYNYCEDLLSELKKNDVELVISGFWYHNDIKGLSPQKNIFGKEDSTDIKSKNDVVELYSKWHFSALWNKIFIRYIIEKNKIRFDEDISIGEDMRFGIDYVNCMNKYKIVVINKPLYHYIQANVNSLWNKNLNQTNTSLQSMDKLFDVLDDDIKKEKKIMFNRRKLNIYDRVFYAVLRGQYPKNKKKEIIESILNDEKYRLCLQECKFGLNEVNRMYFATNFNQFYLNGKKIIWKERIYSYINNVKKINSRCKGKIKSIQKQKLIKNAKNKLNNRDFTIISQNCTGGVFYHDMGMKFLSPTINLHMKAPDYIKFIKNIEFYMKQNLEMRYGEFYPIGKLYDIEVYFNHYNTCKEAASKWNERKNRINYNKLIVIMTDRDGFTSNEMKEFKEVKYKKLLFTGNIEFKDEKDVVYYPEFEEQGYIGDIIDNKKFYKNDILVKKINEIK